MVYLAGFLTVVMHAGLITEPRYGLVERARNTFLKDVQHVIVHGGEGGGSLTVPTGDRTGLTLAEAWNGTWGWGGNSGLKHGHRARRLGVEGITNAGNPGSVAKAVLVDDPGSSGNNSSSHQRRRQLITVSYPDPPGCTFMQARGPSPPPAAQNCHQTRLKVPSFVQIGKYAGAQKTVVGIWLANQTWPDTAWTLVLDDDNVALPSRVAVHLAEVDHNIPLLLAGRIGPGKNKIPCLPEESNSLSISRGLDEGGAAATGLGFVSAGKQEEGHGNASSSTHAEAVSKGQTKPWSCCTDATKPCLAHLTGASGKPLPQSIFSYDAAAGTFVAKEQCTHLKAECCRSEPWSQGEKYGYPYKASANKVAAYRPHFVEMWPFGGAGYALSRGLLFAMESKYWEKCMYALQCANADHRVMTCVANAGFSATQFGSFPTMRHHLPSPSKKCWSSYSIEETEDLDKDLEAEEVKQVDFSAACLSKAEAEAEERSGVWDRLGKPGMVGKFAASSLEKWDQLASGGGSRLKPAATATKAATAVDEGGGGGHHHHHRDVSFNGGRTSSAHDGGTPHTSSSSSSSTAAHTGSDNGNKKRTGHDKPRHDLGKHEKGGGGLNDVESGRREGAGHSSSSGGVGLLPGGGKHSGGGFSNLLSATGGGSSHSHHKHHPSHHHPDQEKRDGDGRALGNPRSALSEDEGTDKKQRLFN